MKIKLKTLEFEKLLYLKGFSKARFAEKIGVTRQFIYMCAAGKCNPGVEKAHLICNELGCKIEDLFEFSEK